MSKIDTKQTGPADQAFNEDLYNILMGAIEPDLTTVMIPILEEMYLGETEDEYRTRMARYADAIDRFKERATKFSDDFQQAIHAIGDNALDLAKQMQQESDDKKIHTTEQSLENS